MSTGLDFNEDMARQVEALYQTVDVVAQRAQTRQLLGLKPGEAVLDIGSGPGFLISEMAGEVGEAGSVHGVDIAPAMLAMAAKRCADKPWARVQEAGATDLPFNDAAFDAVVTVQVFEYVEDIGKALAEIMRVLKPGGRALVIDSDMGTIVFNTADHARMARVLEAWNEHMAHPYLPRTLARRMKAAGFDLSDCGVIPLLNIEHSPEYFSYPMAKMIAQFVTGRQGISEAEARAWADEQHALADVGDYFYAMNRYYFLGQKPN